MLTSIYQKSAEIFFKNWLHSNTIKQINWCPYFQKNMHNYKFMMHCIAYVLVIALTIKPYKHMLTRRCQQSYDHFKFEFVWKFKLSD
jgi:hypothetical protein